MSKWSIPGGAVKLAEIVREAAIREAREECGLDIELIDDKPLDAFDVLTKDNEGLLLYHIVLLQFLAGSKAGTLQLTSDITGARLVLIEEVEQYDLTESFLLFFRKHRNELEKY